MKLESLPPEVVNRVKYFALEHPCAKIIKDAFREFEVYLNVLFNTDLEELDPVKLMTMTSSHTSFMVFNEWKKKCERAQSDVLDPRWLGIYGTMAAVMYYNRLQLKRERRLTRDPKKMKLYDNVLRSFPSR